MTDNFSLNCIDIHFHNTTHTPTTNLIQPIHQPPKP